jgi:Cytochrome c peroxidase
MPLTVEDNGRYKETSIERDRHRFKVPGLRNVALTAPYFHDGTRKTLAEAIQYMAEYQNDILLSAEETTKIEKFLNALTGEYKGKLLTSAK